jgi:hypothetical protein
MCDNAAKTIRSNYLKHMPGPLTEPKNLWERGGGGMGGVQ